ncbi:MAG: GAF domain-containing sensor histidine kinase [Chloroflexi bacterium]|nr:GAF domain-containing sensor histidine kinase [Chloroflexota bacterium]
MKKSRRSVKSNCSPRSQLVRAQEELRQRAAELAIINSVQQGLVTQLHVQDIYDLIGDKIREIFNAQVFMISTYDPQTDTVRHRYAIERGKRVYVTVPQPVGGFRRRIIESAEPLLVNTNVGEQARVLGQPTLPGTETPRSWLGVPMQVGKRVTGVMSLQNLDQENAFTESDVRLLQTLASSLSVALENARLFDETQQRAVELATVNRVSHALASQVELDALIQLAGQQIRETFNADIAYIALLDAANHCIEFPYTFGETFTAIQIGEGLTSKIIETRQPLLINHDMEIRRAQIGATQVGIDVKSYLGVPILVGAQAIGVVSVQSIHHEGRFNENDQHLLMTIAANVGVAIERAQRFHIEKRRAEQFQLIAEIGRNIASLLDTNRIMEQVTQVLRRVFNYYHVGIGLIEGDEVVYRVGAGVLWDDPHFTFKPQRLRIGKEGLTGWVAEHGEPVLLSDVMQDPRYVVMQGCATRSELIVPIVVKDKVIGVLDVQSDQLDAFDSTDLAVAQSIANQTGIAIENARLYERAQELAVLQERNRLARDLHDAVTQTLFSATLIADALPSTWEDNPREGRQLLQELRQLSRGALAEMRTLLLELRPAALIDTKLGDLLRQLGEAASGRTGLNVVVQVESDCKLPPEAHIAMYRIAQEALNNVIKHSRATQVTIDLNCIPGRNHQVQVVELSIRDDGRGFDVNQVSSGRLGLASMRERAQAIGAELTVASRPGGGTQIKVVWDNTPSEEQE